MVTFVGLSEPSRDTSLAMKAKSMHNQRKPEGCTNAQYMRDMMGMHSPRGVASCRGHRGALPPCHETANAPAAWRAHESSRNEMKATRLASPSSA